MPTLFQQVKVSDTSSEFHNQNVDILIDNQTIIQIAPQINTEQSQVIDASGMTIMPGWVDVMADFSEPGYEHKETIDSGLRAARNGGFRHVFIVPNTQPVIHNKSMVEFIVNKSRTGVAKAYPLGAVSKGTEGKELAEMMDMYHAGAIAFSDGWKPVQNAQLLLKALEYVKAFDGIIIQIPINQSLAAGGLMHESPNSVKWGMPGIPSISESLQVYRDLELLRYTDSRLHFSGISSAASLQLIRAAKAEGLQVSCSVTPYHLLYTDDVLETYDSNYKVEPPLRAESDRQALIAGVLDGTIDAIATHHRSHEWDAKTKEFEYTAYGMNTLETTYAMVRKAIPGISTELLSNLLGGNTRKIFRLETATIATGNNDFTIIAPADKWTFNKENKQSIGMNSPLLQQELEGRIITI